MLPEQVKYCFSNNLAKLLKTVATAPIIAAYRERFQYDPAECFAGIDEIGLYECPETGVRFYFPLETAGPESLYQQLQTFDWNYKDEKWEHDIALEHVTPGAKVLDVGCGQGSFLARSAVRGASVTGIEFNTKAGEIARAKGVEILPELLSDHSLKRPDYYDVVTSFQVLEHVTDPHAFIDGCIKVLKPGGRLIIGVPNDDGFLGQDDDAVLNMPPHHMTLWNRASLTAIAAKFEISLEQIEFEPLQETDWYQALMERRYLTSTLKRKIYYKLGFDRVVRRFVVENAHTIHGHTIMAFYRK